MLTTGITMTTLSAWTYIGFLASSPSAPAKSISHPAAVSEEKPISPGAELKCTPETAAAQIRAQPIHHDVMKRAQVTFERNEVKYRLADETGQVWEHHDPVWLQDFVRIRNQQLLNQSR